jgi:site-specific DNA recombinase
MNAATYARYSSDLQSETSIEAQQRLCRSKCDALGLTIVAEHSDLATSGAVPVDKRPGGRALLADALAGRFSVLVVESLDRLSRDLGDADRVVKRLVHRGVRIIGVSDGTDTQAKGNKVVRIARGLVNELYLDDLRDKVHRTLAAKAARGRHVAGLSYGYRSEQAGDDRRLVIVPEQAAIVREVYRRFGDGESAQRIAADLNRRRVPGPRGHTWSTSALYGSPAKLAGVLCNPLYRGRVIWNRSQWIKDPDSGRRTRIDRPRHEWQTTDAPELAIVDAPTWDRVRARMTVGESKRGRPARTLFGGLLRCGACGGAMIAVDGLSYGCAARKDRGATVCAGTRTPREATDARLISAIRATLDDPAAIAQVRAEAAAALKAHASGQESRAARLADLSREVDRLIDAVARMGFSDALRARLERAEAERDALARQAEAILPTVDAVVARYRANLLRVREALATDVDSARAALGGMLGRVRIEQREGGEVWAVPDMQPAALVAAGGESNSGCGGVLLGLASPLRIA